MSTLRKIDFKLIETNESFLTKTLLLGNLLFDLENKSLILNTSINYIFSTARLKQPLL